jgi:hypothetical protein
LGTGPGHWAVAMARTCPRCTHPFDTHTDRTCQNSDQFASAEVVGIDLTEWDLSTTEVTPGDSDVTWELDDLDVWGRDSDITNPTSQPTHHDSSSKSQLPPSHPETSLESLLSPPEPGWHFSTPFSLIHLRNMQGAFSSWSSVYAEIYQNLAPNGYIEVADYDLSHFPDAAIPKLRALHAATVSASFASGRPLGIHYMHASYLEEAGFVEIQTTHVNVPVGQWADDEAQRSVGKMMLVVVLETMEAGSLRLCTKWGGWTVEEVGEKVLEARREVTEYVARMERGEVEGWCVGFRWITGRKRRGG